jgi:hypothetical protein
MSWGYKVTILFVGFAVMIGTLVYKCTQQHYDLVSADYYDQELKYQDKIDGSKQAAAISPVTISQTENDVVIQMPAELKGEAMQGEVWLYCASNAADDIRLPLQVNYDGIMHINKGKIAGFNYTAKITWNSDNINYYKELPLIVSR